MKGTWVKLSDDFFDHPKVVRAGNDAALLYLAGLCHCGRHLTDGLIAVEVVPRLLGDGKSGEQTAALVREGLWHDATKGCKRCRKPPEGHLLVHDWQDHQRTREQVEHERASAGERKRRERRGQERGHGVTPPVETEESPEPYPELENTTAGSARSRSTSQPVPDPFPITEEMRTWAAAETPAIDVDFETVMFVDSALAEGWRHPEEAWGRVWRNCMRRAQERF